MRFFRFPTELAEYMNKALNIPSVAKRDGYHHGNLRDHLIAATRILIEQDGVDEFKVSHACRHAGVSTAAPYRHFADKHALLDAVATTGFNDLRDSARAAGAPFEKGSVDAVSAIGKAYVAFAVQNPRLFRLMFTLSEDNEDTQPSPNEQAGRECYEVLLEQLVITLNRPTIDKLVIEAAFPLWTFVHGLAFLLIDDKLSVNEMPIDIEQQIERATACLMPTRVN